jgi:GNAT superfamily N-acetyltransferase
MSNIYFSKVESDRFGKKIYRGTLDTIDIPLISECLGTNDSDILIFRVPVSEQPSLYKLNKLGREVIVADTLVYYQVDLNKTFYNPIKNKDQFLRQATPADTEIFKELIPVIFKDYTTHYFSNPLLDRTKINEGYTEWAINYINAPQKVNFISYVDERPAGFITCNLDEEGAEIILNGVHPEYAGKGLYSDMVRYVKQYYHDMGVSVLRVSTQIQNIKVQSVWSKEGLVLNKAYITIHLNNISKSNDSI